MLQVEAVAVDVVEPAELVAVDQRLQPRDRGVVLEQVPDHENLAGVIGRGDSALGVGGGGGERLLDEAVLARLGDGDRELSVRGHRRGEHDRVELLVGEEIVERAGGARGWKRALEPCARVRRGVAQPAQLAARDRGEVAREVRAPVAEPDDADADGPLVAHRARAGVLIGPQCPVRSGCLF